MTKAASYANRYQVRQKTRALYTHDKGGYAERRDHGRQIRAINFNNNTAERKANHEEGNCKLQDIDNKMVSLTEKVEAVVRAVTASNNNNKSVAHDIVDNRKPLDKRVTKEQKLITCFRCDKAGHLARECRVGIIIQGLVSLIYSR